MSIVTKNEYEKDEKTSNKYFIVGIAIIVGGIIISLILGLVFNYFFSPLICVLMAFIIGTPMIAFSKDQRTFKCSRCGEYWKNEHPEKECLCALKNKLDNVKCFEE